MRTKELIDLIKYNELLSKDVCEEIIQKLLEYDDLRKLVYDTMDVIEELYCFLFEITGDFE